MREMTQPESVRAATRVVLVTLVLAGCGSSPAASGPSPGTAFTRTPTIAPVTSPSPSGAAATPSPVPATTPAIDGPPAGRLSAEGGDPVTGQLGTYSWADGGSDSPWLPGATISVGAGEPLTVVFDPAISIETWQARSVPWTASGPAGATDLGTGSGDPTFAAPGAGSWTVEVHVAFGDGAGDASYF